MIYEHSSESYQDRITDEAAEWFERIHDGAFSEEERTNFVIWLQASAEHVREYLQIAAMWDELQECGAGLDVDKLVELAQSDEDKNILPLFGIELGESIAEGTEDLESKNPGFWKYAGFAAMFILSTTIVFFFVTYSKQTVFQTELGEQSSYALSDGSIVTLNTLSEVRIEYSDDYRDIVLSKGEVFFDVAKDPARKFRVITSDAMIEAIGTQFNIRSRGADTTVTVVEGIIAVNKANKDLALSTLEETVKVTTGQQAQLDSGTAGISLKKADLTTVTAWQQRQLIFDSWPLASVITEFNLYNDPPIIITDSELEKLSISGVFSANDRASFILFLKETNLARASFHHDGRILLSKK